MRNTRSAPVLALALGMLLFLAVALPRGVASGVQVPESVLADLADGSADVVVALRSEDVRSRLSEAQRKTGRVEAQRQAAETLGLRMRTVEAGLPGAVTILERYEQIGGMLVRVRDEAALLALASHPDVVGLSTPTMAYPQLNESLQLIRQPEAAAAGWAGAGGVVAVLDTGIDYAQGAFGTCPAPGASGCRVLYAQDFSPDDGSRDDDGHGTNVGAIVAGVAPGANLLALDVCTYFPELQRQGCPEQSLTSAINWILGHLDTYAVSVINVSIGGGVYSSTCDSVSPNYAAAFASLRANGILPVVAAGNEASANGVSHPACFSANYVVGAVYDANLGEAAWLNCTDQTTYADRVVCFSNSHSTLLDSLAPGAMITAGGRTMGGTSQATPHVAGAAAVLSAMNGVGLADVEGALLGTGPLITDSRNGVVKRRLDLAAATASLEREGPPNDELAGATTIDTVPFKQRAQDTTAATSGTSDPAICSADGTNRIHSNSVWFHFRPMATMPAIAVTQGSNYDTVVAIWRFANGSYGAPMCNDDISARVLQSRVLFNAVAGSSYVIEVASYCAAAPCDGGGSLTLTVSASCEIRAATRVGTASGEVINGTNRRDIIASLAGNDTVNGAGGNDFICTGGGADRIDGGPGVDVCNFGPAQDTHLGNCETRKDLP